MASRPRTQAAGGVTLEVRVTPRSSRDAIEGLERRADGKMMLKVRVRAAPVEGEANEALRRLIAKQLGVAPRQVDVVTGATARLKRLRISGDTQMLASMLQRLTDVAT